MTRTLTLRSVPRLAAAAATATLLTGVLPITVAAPVAVAAPSACPAAYPLGDVRIGQDVEGLTVERGQTPDRFTAEVLGVIENGIAPGLDLIVAEATSPAIERAGGIWAGMSGSPVYAADGRLVGAVAYGLSYGASPIAGITPAEEMYRLLDGGRRPASAPASTVELPARLEDRIVATGAASEREVGGGMSMLSMPLGVSGLGASNQRVVEELGELIPNAKVFASSAASSRASQAPRPLVAGGNVAAALSYGDVSAAGIGTVTAVCGGEALLFGHPFNFAGRTTLSAHQASALFVQPGGIEAGFKVANPGRIVGTVDEDRLAGLHTSIAEMPDPARVRGTLTGLETGLTRRSTTWAVEPGFAPSAAAYHALFNLDRVADRRGGGVVELKWSAEGRRANGRLWRLERREVVADEYDTSYIAGYTIFSALTSLLENDVERITLESVEMRGTTSPRFNEGRIIALQKLGGKGRWRTIEPRERLDLVAGSDAYLRAVIQQPRSTRTRTHQVVVRVPRAVGARGTLSVVGGGGFFYFFDEFGGSSGEGVGAIIDSIESRPTGDTITATISLRDEDGARFRSERRTRAATAVTGRRSYSVQVVAPTR